tara:strand:- start:682 stop:2100 length:1419 start_codon:yes stop_codon:yes gene_type:complete
MPITRKFQFLFGVESSEGQAATLGASNAVQAYEPQLSGGPSFDDRTPTGASLSRGPKSIGRDEGEFTCKTDFRGSGDTSDPITEPDWGVLGKCSGLVAFTPSSVAVGAPSSGTGIQFGEIVFTGATRGVVIGLLASGVPVDQLTGAGTLILAMLTSGEFATADTLEGESSGTQADATGDSAAYAGVAYKPTSRKLFNIVTAAACAAAVDEIVTFERAGIFVGAAQVVVNNGAFTDVEMSLIEGNVAQGDTVRAADGVSTTTISAPGPVQTETTSGTAQFNEDGEQSQLLGSRTSWSLDGEAGGPLQFTWTMRGNPTTPVDASPVATTGLGTITAPNFRGAICSYAYNSQIHRLSTKSLSFTNGGQIEDNLDANAVSGANGSDVVDRAPVISTTVDRTHSAFPWRTLQREGTNVRVAYMLGTTPGNIVGIVAPKCQVEGVQRSNSNGKMTWDLQLNPLKVLEQGDDDFYLVQL